MLMQIMLIKKLISKNCAPFISCISKIDKTQVDNAKDADIVMSMYNLIDYTLNYLVTSPIFWHYFREEPVVNNNGAIVNFNEANDNESFKFKIK